MNNITPKEAIANLNHIYGMVAPDIQRSLDVAIKVLENQPTEGDLISREALKKDLISYVRDKFEFVCLSCVLDEIDNAQAVPQVTVFTESTDEKAIEDMKAELQSVIDARPQGDLISRSELLKHSYGGDYDGCGGFTREYVYVKDINNAPTVEPICPYLSDNEVKQPCLQSPCGNDKRWCESCVSKGKCEVTRPQGKWYDFIPNCLKARHGEYVLYKVDFLLDNLAREVNIMESARRMKGGAE